jgi:hypothetical protein
MSNLNFRSKLHYALKVYLFIYSVSNRRDERENYCIPVEETERC